MLRNGGRVFAFVLATIAVLSTALFVARRWIPEAASQHAKVLDKQLRWSLVDAAVIFLLAQFTLGYIVWNSQTKTLAKRSRVGVRIAIWFGVIFIGIELLSAATLGRSAWAAMYDAPPDADTIRVQALGQQFAFYFRYPGRDGKFGPVHVDKMDPSVANYFGLDRIKDADSRDDVVDPTLVLPVNRPVEVLLLSEDVIHGFYVRELRIQQDMVPGMEIPVHFTPTRVGKYEIVCSQLCGLGHYRMHAYLEVVPEADFEKWIRAHGH